uniref:Uncharacterized protein n=1 Tax=Anguilla anguilla TaxID=7936 RepID=A0A0E9P947_ANGAN
MFYVTVARCHGCSEGSGDLPELPPLLLCRGRRAVR